MRKAKALQAANNFRANTKLTRTKLQAFSSCIPIPHIRTSCVRISRIRVFMLTALMLACPSIFFSLQPSAANTNRSSTDSATDTDSVVASNSFFESLAAGLAAHAANTDNGVVDDSSVVDDVVDVIEVSGTFDGIVTDFIVEAIDRANMRPPIALVLQVDSASSTVDSERFNRLVDKIINSHVPIAMWIGPSGARATHLAGQLAGVMSDLALAPGSELGVLGTSKIAQEHLTEEFKAAYDKMASSNIDQKTAIELRLAREAPTLPYFVLDIPGFRTEIDTSNDEPVRLPLSRVRFVKLPVLDQFMHIVSSPAITYLTLLLGAVLLVLELYTAGIGIAGFTGALLFVLGCYGLASQPFQIEAVILLLVAVFGYCIDIQAGAPRVWTAIATVCLVFGSLRLFEDTPLSPVTLIAGISGAVLAMVVGLPAMVRSRFTMPTFGREWMIGSAGMALEPINPDGAVTVDGASWLARTNRAQPIEAGQKVKIVSIEGLSLNVEPLDEPLTSGNVEPQDVKPQTDDMQADNLGTSAERDLS